VQPTRAVAGLKADHYGEPALVRRLCSALQNLSAFVLPRVPKPDSSLRAWPKSRAQVKWPTPVLRIPGL